jgi:type I restriction enzyme S subunit
MTSAYLAVRPRGSDSRFMSYLLRAYDVSKVFYSMGGGLRQAMKFGDLKRLPVLLPPIAEQVAIANFLDRETASIDVLLAEQQRLIELLEEKRQAAISYTITRGLNPLVPMQNTGIAWLGKVPAHWQAGPLKRFWDVIDCKHVTVPFLDNGLPIASVMEVRSFDLDLSEALRTSEDSYKLLIEGGRRPLRGDVIYCRNTANTGTSAYVNTDEPMALGQDVCLIKSRHQDGRYLNYVLHSEPMALQLATVMVGSTFKRINVAEINTLLVPCPPRAEQIEIAAHLDCECARWNLLAAEVQTSTTLLRERRTALISAAVTGQIDVRQLA